MLLPTTLRRRVLLRLLEEEEEKEEEEKKRKEGGYASRCGMANAEEEETKGTSATRTFTYNSPIGRPMIVLALPSLYAGGCGEILPRPCPIR